MRVVAVHTYYRQLGGEDLSFESECDLLERRGHEVTRFVLRNDELTDGTALSAAVSTIWNRQSKARLQQTLHDVRPDVMHCTNTFPLISPAAHWAAAQEGVAVVQALRNYRLICPGATLFRDGKVCTDCVQRRFAWPGVLHGCYHHSRAATATVAVGNWLHRSLGTYRHVDLFYTPSRFAQEQFAAANPGFDAARIRVKPNFLDPAPSFCADGGGGAIFVGRLTPEKGIAVMLDAWRRLAQPIPLRVVGDGPMRDAVVEAARCDRRITYLGALPPQRAVEEIGRADCLVMPSVWYETFGRTMMEAFARGTPAVASDLGAMAELVEDGRTGVRFASGDAASLAGAVSGLLADPARLKQMRFSSRRVFEERFTGDVNYRALLGLYEEAVDHARRRRPDAARGPAFISLPVIHPVAGFAPPVAGQRPLPRKRAAANRPKPARRTSSLLAICDQGVVSLANFATVVCVGKFGGAFLLGEYTLAFAVLVLLLTLQDCCVATPYTVFCGEHGGRAARRFTGNLMLLGGLLGLSLAAVGLVVALLAGVVDLPGVPAGLAWAMAVTAPAGLARELVRRISLASLHVGRALLVDSVTAVVQLGVLVGLVLWTDMTSAGAVVSLGVGAAAGVLLWMVLQRGQWAVHLGSIRRHWSRALHFGKWTCAARLTSTIHSYVVPWLLGVMVSLEAVGGFSACFALIAAANPMLMGFTNLLAPQAARAFAQGGSGAVRRVVGRATWTLSVVALVFAAAIIGLAEVMLRMLYGEAFVPFAPVATPLAVALVVSAVGTPADHGLRAVQRPQAGVWAGAFGFVTTLAGSILLIPAAGLAGGPGHCWGARRCRRGCGGCCLPATRARRTSRPPRRVTRWRPHHAPREPPAALPRGAAIHVGVGGARAVEPRPDRGLATGPDQPAVAGRKRAGAVLPPVARSSWPARGVRHAGPVRGAHADPAQVRCAGGGGREARAARRCGSSGRTTTTARRCERSTASTSRAASGSSTAPRLSGAGTTATRPAGPAG